MPNWSGTVLTSKGLALQAKVEAGTVMNITKLKIGDGVLGTGQTVATLNDLVHPIKIIDISALTPLANGTCKIHGIATNAGIEDGFYVRELGVFAQDPDVGEILYAYTADGSPDFLPPEGGPVAVSEELVINLAFSNATSITASIAMDGLVTVAVMQNAVNVHDNDPDAHGNRYLKLAGGEMSGPITLAADPTTDMEAATKQYADNNGGVNLRKNSHTYAVGDICYSKTAASYKYMQCTVGGVTAATEPTWPDVGQTVVDGGVTWVVRDIRAGEQVGSIKAWLANAAPAGWLALDTGAMVGRETYPQLWAWVQANAPLITEAEWQAQAAVQSSVGAYSSGDGSTTFRLPRLVDYQRGGLASDVGTWQGDAIRNITGWFNGKLSAGGAFRSETTGYGGGEVNSGGNGVTFDASRQVPTANENRPKTIRFLYCVKAFDALTNQGLIDITELANKVAGKAPGFKWVSVYRGSGGAQSIASVTTTKVSLNTVTLDTNNFWDSSNSRINIPAGVGKVNVIGSVEWPDNFTTEHSGRAVFIYKNGAAVATVSQPGLNGSLIHQVAAPMLAVTDGDYIELYIRNSDSAAKTITANVNTYLALEVIG
ncbi:hypothetical protein M7775_13755 [Sporomusa sphaeroides DSM 2875]|uniref:hypothetical protein n=1 Tax=Sporomusa sphaeroides TaxID=47679 RepID=UPI00202EC180|nr:hypothetical protein [Sporomusa sphaeroides]MCM0759619.1 hypothetical protein [Sporomusa sphaeroides DSM 2875]